LILLPPLLSLSAAVHRNTYFFKAKQPNSDARLAASRIVS